MPPLTYNSSQYLYRVIGLSFPVTRYFEEIRSKNFAAAVAQDLPTINTPDQGNSFFQEQAMFIQAYHDQSQNHLGYMAWLELLNVVQDVNPQLYNNIHKGTAYYFSSIFALRSNRFLEGLELMDYGYTEDIKSFPNPLTTPGGFYISLSYPQGGNDMGEGQRLDGRLKEVLARLPTYENRRFSIRFLRSRSKRYYLTKRNVARRSAWVALLATILASQETYRFIKVTPNYGEAQPVAKLELTSLCLILETFLSSSPIAKNMTFTRKDLERCYQALIDNKLPLVKSNRSSIYTSLKNAPYESWVTKINSYQSAFGPEAVGFSLAHVLRNTVNHIFLESQIELELYNTIFDLLIYVIFVTMKLLY